MADNKTYIKGNAVDNATSYELAEKNADGTYTTITTKNVIDFEISALSLAEGDHTFAVKAKADGYEDSDYSNEVDYTVKGVSWYPMASAEVTASKAQLGATYQFSRPVLPDETSHHFTKFETIFKPTKDGDFNFAILVAEFDDSDGSLLIVSKEIHTVTDVQTGDKPVSIDIDITIQPNQIIGVAAPSQYQYMTSGSTYSGVWNLVCGTGTSADYSDFVVGQKMSKNPTTSAGKLAWLFFLEG